MPRCAANLSLLFTEVELPQRFARAAQAGFAAVEFQFPYGYPAAQLAEQAQRNRLQIVLHNLPAGNLEQGERGIAILPGRQGEFQEGVGRAIEYAKALSCTRLNCLAGIEPQGANPQRLRQTLVENLHFAAQALAKERLQLLVEPINRQDIPGFYLQRSGQTLEVLDAVGHPNAWLQYDIYHMQITEGDLTHTIRTHLPRIAHMQLADVPGRHEPGTGEINFPNLFRFIDEAGYQGWIGAEYKPAAGTEAGLGWMQPYLRKG